MGAAIRPNDISALLTAFGLPLCTVAGGLSAPFGKIETESP
jgi:hypothetical protein